MILSIVKQIEDFMNGRLQAYVIWKNTMFFLRNSQFCLS